MNNIPNLLTFARLVAVPIVAYCIISKYYAVAAIFFLLAALSDLADGYIARRFKLVSKLGALLDPVADKLNMFVATVALAWQGLLPLWLALAIVARDIAIVGGVLAYRASGRRLEMNPTRLSKLNTFLEFGVLLVVLLTAARFVEAPAWLAPLFLIVVASVVASAAQYTWLWLRGRLVSHPVQ